MATLSTAGWPTITQILKMTAPDGSAVRSMGEVLNTLMPMVNDIPWYPGNMPGGHRITNEYALPSVAWRAANEGISASFGRTVQYDEQAGQITSLRKTDRSVANFGGPDAAAAFRLRQQRMAMEKFKQTIESALFYSSLFTTPKQIHGLSPRYAATSGYTASAYVKKGTNDGTNTYSAWLINWGPNRIYGFYPPGTTAGLHHDDLRLDLASGYGGGEMPAFRDWYQWDCGFAVEDYRHAVRWQHDLDDATAGFSFAAAGLGMLLMLNQMLSTIFPMADAENAAFYVNRSSWERLQAQLINSGGSDLLQNFQTKQGEWVTGYNRKRIRVTESLVNEAAIS